MTSSRKTKLISVGVDVGTINGAISVVDEDGKILVLTRTPIYQTEIKSRRNKSKLNKETGKYEADFRKRTWVEFRKLREIFEPYLDFKILYTIEKMQARSGEGENATFVNGNSLGIFQGLYALLQPIQYLEPTPKEWKSTLGLSALKEKSVNLAKEIYKVDFRKYLSKGKVDDLAEALLLSFYGFMQYNLKGK